MSKCPSKEQLLQDVFSDLSWLEIAEKYGYSDARFLRKKAREWNLPPRRVILKPSKELLSDMLYRQEMTPSEIAAALGYGNGGWSNIYAYCREYGLQFDYSQNHALKSIPFSARQQEIVFGTLLGDGYLRPTNGNRGNSSYSLALCHGKNSLNTSNGNSMNSKPLLRQKIFVSIRGPSKAMLQPIVSARSRIRF